MRQRGKVEPADPNLLSEPRIVAGLAKATLEKNDRVDWERWSGDYDLIREAIASTYPAIFADFNLRIVMPGGIRQAQLGAGTAVEDEKRQSDIHRAVLPFGRS